MCVSGCCFIHGVFAGRISTPVTVPTVTVSWSFSICAVIGSVMEPRQRRSHMLSTFMHIEHTQTHTQNMYWTSE